MFTVFGYLAAGIIALVFGVIGGLVRMIFAARAMQARRRPPLSEPERYLGRAGRAAGSAALLLLAAVVYQANGGSILRTIEVDSGWPALIYAGLLALCLVQLIIGVCGSWGLRKRELAVGAFIKLAGGGGLAIYLARQFAILHLPAMPAWSLLPAWFLHWWPHFAAQAGFVVGLWCLVTGAVRLLLLTIGGSGALRRVLQHIRVRVGRLRPARPRSY
jgi:hypothetical protein